MPTMRAKMIIDSIEHHNDECETLSFMAVGRNDIYPDDGSDEDNTYSQFTPSARLQVDITNPDLIGKLKEGEAYYLDFTKATL